MITKSLIADNILDLIGHTPMLRLTRLAPKESAELLVKLESFNPSGSVKDRIAISMIEDAEQQGTISPGDTIVEPTSGNTGIGLAMVAAVKGYRLIVTMPEDASLARHDLLTRYGVEVVLTPAIEGMSGAVFAAQELAREHARYFMPQQFKNPANPEIHRLTTAQEILNDCDGQLDAFVAGVGTGGTITGVGEVLKDANPEILIVAVEPARSAVLQGRRANVHSIQGIGASFIPDILNLELLDEVVSVGDEDAFETARNLARQEGLLVGVSAGAAAWAALRIAKTLGVGKRVVTILPDTGERYQQMDS